MAASILSHHLRRRGFLLRATRNTARLTHVASIADATFTEGVLVRVGNPTSPRLDCVRHRLLPSATMHDVSVSEDNGTMFVNAEPVHHDSSGLALSSPAGVSTYEGTLPPFALAAAMTQPQHAAMWTLKAGSHIPPQLVVRRDPFNSRRVLWRPRYHMSLSEYTSALACVGRGGAEGALLRWTRWHDPLQLLQSLPLSAGEKDQLRAAADGLLDRACRRATTPAEFLGRAMIASAFERVGTEDSTAHIDFLGAMAQLGAAIYEDGQGTGICAAVAAACRQLWPAAGAPGAVAGAGAGAGAGLATRTASQRRHADFIVIIRVLDCSDARLAIQAAEARFMYQALEFARGEVMALADGLPHKDGEQFDAGVEAMRQQGELGRRAAAVLGFTDMWW